MSPKPFVITSSTYPASVRFLSFYLGVKLRPEDIQIDQLSHKEMTSALETDTYVDCHDVHYLWPEEKINSRDLWIGGSPAMARDDEELAALRACLVAWMDRAQTWMKSYAMMMNSFALKNVVSAERLITACRWLEEVPTAQSRNAILNRDIVEISAAAARKAQELGYKSTISDRIANAISWVKESRRKNGLAALLRWWKKNLAREFFRRTRSRTLDAQFNSAAKLLMGTSAQQTRENLPHSQNQLGQWKRSAIC